MIEVFLYGDLKRQVEQSNPNAGAIMLCEYIEDERFQDLLRRLGLNLDDVGECYINNTLAEPENEIHDRDTIEINQRV
ncbi:MAG: hypothetical protein ACFFD9_06260 [Candidatus Thorarchaeota archaeon]